MGTLGPAGIFVGGGASPKYPLYVQKKTTQMEKKVAKKAPHGKKQFPMKRKT